jgi:hypothetical protein
MINRMGPSERLADAARAPAREKSRELLSANPVSGVYPFLDNYGGETPVSSQIGSELMNRGRSG